VNNDIEGKIICKLKEYMHVFVKLCLTKILGLTIFVLHVNMVIENVNFSPGYGFNLR